MNIYIVNGFDTYEHRVDLLYKFFTDEGHQVNVLTSDFRHFEKTKRTEPKDGYHFFEAKPYYKNLSYKRIRSHMVLSKVIFNYLEESSEKVDLLWVLVPPNSFVKDASKYKQKHNDTKLVFDLIDLWPETMPIGSIKNVFPFTVWKNIRDKNIGYADIVFTECDLYQKKLEKVLRGTKAQTLYLARPLEEYNPKVNLPSDRINLCYLGSINNIIDIGVIVDIVKNVIKTKPVELHIVGDGEKRIEFIDALKEAGASIVFHGKVYDRDDKQRIFDCCHYGLNIMKQTVCVGLTMKSMDYMEFGLPMINNIQGDTWNIIEKERMGINISHLERITEEYDLNMRTKSRVFFENNLSIEQFESVVSRVFE